MASFKKLSKSDVTFVPYHANKQWNLTYCPYPTSSEYLTIYNGTNLTGSFSPDGDPITEDQYDRLVYSQINQLFYQKYTASLNTSSLANSIYYESASQQRPTSSYFIYNDSARLVENFPTGAMQGIRVLAINQDIYGDKVLPNHFRLSSSAYNITDDGYGNLYNATTHVGNIFYAHGLGVITNQDYQMMFPLPPIAKANSGSFLTLDTPKTISASANDYARSGTLNTSSLAFSGSTSGNGYSWATGSKGTIILTTTTPGTYTVWYTIGADIAGSCAINLRSNKAKITAVVTAGPTTTTTTSTTTSTTTEPTTTTTSTTTSTTTEPTTTTTSTTTSTTTEPTTTTTSTTTTTTTEPTTTTTSTTSTTSTSTTTTSTTISTYDLQISMKESATTTDLSDLFYKVDAGAYSSTTGISNTTTYALQHTITGLSGGEVIRIYTERQTGNAGNTFGADTVNTVGSSGFCSSDSGATGYYEITMPASNTNVYINMQVSAGVLVTC